MRIEPSGFLFNGVSTTQNTIAGSAANAVTANVRGATIAGGGLPTGDSDPFYFSEGPNLVTDAFGTVSGGFDNRAGDGAGDEFGSGLATVAGGAYNTASGYNSTIGGGATNLALGSQSVVSGGTRNIANGQISIVGGGVFNEALGTGSTVGGGVANCAGGDNSWAGGRLAKIRHGNGAGDLPCSDVTSSSGDANGDNGTFAWADDEGAFLTSTGPNQFLVRAAGGVMFNTSSLPNPGADDLVVATRSGGSGGDEDADLVWLSRSNKSGRMYLSDSTGGFVIGSPNLSAGSSRLVVAAGTGGNASLSNGGVWTNASSREFKTGFAAVNPLELLTKVIGLPLSTWTYKGSLEGTHMGPMAEDFKAAFGLAGDGKAIGTVDADGVALAAIQGLNQKLESENAVLKARLNAQDARLRALEAKSK